jgi:hypothetical protein
VYTYIAQEEYRVVKRVKRREGLLREGLLLADRRQRGLGRVGS